VCVCACTMGGHYVCMRCMGPQQPGGIRYSPSMNVRVGAGHPVVPDDLSVSGTHMDPQGCVTTPAISFDINPSRPCDALSPYRMRQAASPLPPLVCTGEVSPLLTPAGPLASPTSKVGDICSDISDAPSHFRGGATCSNQATRHTSPGS
jgi:hypothetical protein